MDPEDFTIDVELFEKVVAYINISPIHNGEDLYKFLLKFHGINASTLKKLNQSFAFITDAITNYSFNISQVVPKMGKTYECIYFYPQHEAYTLFVISMLLMWTKKVLDLDGLDFKYMYENLDSPLILEKFYCILNYMNICQTHGFSRGDLVFEKKILNRNIDWSNDKRNLTKKLFAHKGFIEDLRDASIGHMIYSKKNIGGDIMRKDCTRQEAYFLTCPTLLISRLFLSNLTDREALIVQNAYTFNSYQGHGEIFRYSALKQEKYQTNVLLCIDTLDIGKSDKKYEKSVINRELNKIVSALNGSFTPEVIAADAHLFGSDVGSIDLRVAIQILAVLSCGKKFYSCTNQNGQLYERVEKLGRSITSKSPTVQKFYIELIRLAHSRKENFSLNELAESL